MSALRLRAQPAFATLTPAIDAFTCSNAAPEGRVMIEGVFQGLVEGHNLRGGARCVADCAWAPDDAARTATMAIAEQRRRIIGGLFAAGRCARTSRRTIR